MLAFEVSESFTTNIQDFLSVSKLVTLTAFLVIEVDSCDSSKANCKLMSLIIILEIKSDFT